MQATEEITRAKRGLMKIAIAVFVCVLSLGAAENSDVYSANELAKMKAELADKKQSFASLDLKRYGNHYTMLAYRSATGSAEVHEHEADIFVVQEGDSTILLGGKLVGGHTTKPGELRGTSIDGGERKPLKTGDIIHIPAGVPHQILVTSGKPFTYFVIKVMGQ
jgi:mannose-6-phosphate isomerase-like protein (cupin superfamily)